MEMTEKIYLETLKSVLGRSISHYSAREKNRLVPLNEIPTDKETPLANAAMEIPLSNNC